MNEEVSGDLKGYIDEYTTPDISYRTWNGDFIAGLVAEHFMKEGLFPKGVQSFLRKSIAMVDEPEASYKYFYRFAHSLLKEAKATDDSKKKLLLSRQMAIGLWMHFGWSVSNQSLEAAYRISELSLLLEWELLKDNTRNKSCVSLITSALVAHRRVSLEFMSQNVLPYVQGLHVMSSAVQGYGFIDVNLKLFDILGRVAACGIFAYWDYLIEVKQGGDFEDQLLAEVNSYVNAIEWLVSNNPALKLTISERQTADLMLAMLLLFTVKDDSSFLTDWLKEMLSRANLSYQLRENYPVVIEDYDKLLAVYELAEKDQEYYKQVTTSSILYPFLAYLSCLLNRADLYERIKTIKRNHLKHCDFQVWYPSDDTEENLYTNASIHGVCLSIDIDSMTSEEYASVIRSEIKHQNCIEKISTFKQGFWALFSIATRHYGLPLPFILFENDMEQSE